MNKSEKFWDKRSREYDRNEKKYEQTYNQIIENTKRHLNNSDIVLDYGCGTGVITNKFTGDIKEIHAIDISSKMIDVAKRKADDLKIENIIYTQSTIFDDDYKIESYDAVLAFNILHLFADIQKVLQRTCELLKPGGLFISATSCIGEKKSFLSLLMAFLSKLRIFPYIRILKFSELEALIADRYFDIVETQDLKQTPPNFFIVAKKR